jgi:MerR family transcriptional regulator, light-induced transcriptional regulator
MGVVPPGEHETSAGRLIHLDPGYDQRVPEDGLGVGAVAQRLGIGASTLRSWEHRYGLTRPRAAPGRHRRYSPADLERLAAMVELVRNGMPPGQAATLITTGPATRSQFAALAGRLRAASDVMNGGYIAAIVRAALLRYGTVLAWTEIIVPVLVAAGEYWERHGDGVDREHVLSGTTDAVLRAHAHQVLAPEPGRRPVLLAAAPGEEHTLPLTALVAALAERDTAAVLLAGLSGAELRNALTRQQPRKAVVWARSRETASQVTLLALVAEGRRVYAAGPGWDAATLPAGVRHVATLAAALRILAPVARRGAQGSDKAPRAPASVASQAAKASVPS